MLFILSVQSGHHIQHVLFENEETAKTQLDVIRSRMGYGGRNADETVTISSPSGDVVFVANRIDCARIINEQLHEDMSLQNLARRQDNDIEFEVRKKKALMAVSSEIMP